MEGGTDVFLLTKAKPALQLLQIFPFQAHVKVEIMI